MATAPTFCRIEYFNTRDEAWVTGHAGINLMNPGKYVADLSDNNKIARAVDPYTNEVVATNEDMWDLSEFDMNDATPVSDDLTKALHPEVDLSEMDPSTMTDEQLRTALMAEGTPADDVKSYGSGFMVKALIALRTPAPEPEPDEEEDMFDDLAEFDDITSGSTAVKAATLAKGYGADLSEGAIEPDDAWLDTAVAEGVAAIEDDLFDDLADLDDVTDEDIKDLKDRLEDVAPTYDPTPLFLGMPTTKDYIFDGHAGAGPSGSERWMNCTASLGASRAFLETLTPNQQEEFSKAGQAARQGTTAHAVGESQARLMLGQITEEEHDNKMLDLTIDPPDGEEFDEEMAEYITEYSDLVKKYADDGHEVLIEERVTATVELTTVTNGERDTHEIKGSVDFAALPLPRKTKRQVRVLTAGDLKYGKGVEVEADENSQAKIYALGLIERLVEMGEDIWDIDRVDIIIIQPRLGGIKTWSTTVDDLLEWRDDVLSPALTEALGGLKGGAAFTPGEVQCQWCPARGGCAALAESRMEQAIDLFDTIIESESGGEPFPETTTLSDARLGDLYSQIEGLQQIRDDLKAEMQRRLHRGGSIPGYQLVNYQPPRHWDTDVEVEDIIEGALPEEVVDLLHSKKLLSPPAAIKILGKGNEGALKVIEPLVIKPDIRPVVAPVGDKRKTYVGKPPESMFDDLPEEG